MRRLIFLLGLAGALLGCPSEEPESGACEDLSSDPLDVEAAERGSSETLVDGATLAVFVPPQGGVATELDVSFFGTTAEDLQTVRVDIIDAMGMPRAAASYFGSGLPVTCRENTSLEVRSMPVPFNDGLMIEELDQVAVTLRLTVIREDAEDVEVEYDVTLVATDY